MVIKELEVKDFRNYGYQKVCFKGGLNVLMGANAQGKTNLLEAVYICCVGRSPRTMKDKELILWGKESARINLKAEKKIGDVSVEIRFSQKENKRVAINSLPIMRIGELMGVVNCVFFSPDELKIVKESPSDRRRFMDIDISQMSKTYFYLLNRYNKVLTQRNKLLKGGDSGALESTLPVWDMQLAEAGAKIILTRKKFIKKLNGFVREEHLYLTGGAEELTLEYEGIDGEDFEEIKQNFLNALEAARRRDLKNGFTSEGPHKDDFSIRCKGTDLRAYGSQGQQRTAALSLKLAELEIFAQEAGEYPVLLLDDVLSELDKSRSAQLINRIRKVQTILTCTHMDLPADGAEYFTVKEGKIVGDTAAE